MRIRKSVFDTRFAAKLRGTCTDRKVETSQVESDIQNEPIVDSSLLAHQNALLPVRIRHFTMMHAHTVVSVRVARILDLGIFHRPARLSGRQM